MKEKTKWMLNESEKDIRKIYQHNNSKEARRTEAQNLQHRDDKRTFYLKKWNAMRKVSETKAQIDACENVLSRINNIR